MGGRDRRKVGLIGAIGAYVAGAAFIAPSVFLAMLLMYRGAFVVMLGVTAVLVIAKLLGRSLRRPGAEPLPRATWLRPAIAMALAGVGLAAFSTYKLQIPSIVPFYLDAALADLDRWLHGEDPWEALHRVLPAGAGAALVLIYLPVWNLVNMVVLALVALHEDEALRLRFYWTLLGAVAVLGTAMATALSSVGPIFLERITGDDRFAGLLARLSEGRWGGAILAVADHLHANYAERGNGFGGGISAMPSMHLAMATLCALALSAMHPRLAPLGILHVAVIQVGSVYLAWHYAIDGYVSIAAVVVIWWAVGRALARRGAAPTRAGAAAQGLRPAPGG